MTQKVQNGLDESRMLVLGVQVLAGFQYQAVFQKQFALLPVDAQWTKIVALWLLLVAMLLLMSPASFHQISERGHATSRLHRFICLIGAPALLPFALALGGDFYVGLIRVIGRTGAASVATGAALVALGFWYGLEYVVKRRRGPGKGALEMDRSTSEDEKPTPLAERIKMVMTEARVVLPGAQALVGFQFAATLTEAFDKLSPMLKMAHLVSLGLVALAVIFLMSPAAYHRIVENGEDTEGVHRFSSRMVIAAMVVLAPGVCGDLFVVSSKVFGAPLAAALFALFTLVLFYGFWFGYTLFVRSRRGQAAADRLPAPKAA